MKMIRFNWHVWAGFLLSLIALASYPFIYLNWSITGDIPWINLALFVIAAALLFVGVRRGFASDRPHPTRSKIGASTLTMLSVLLLAIFVFSFFIASRWMPASRGAPQVGQKAPDFSLPDTNGKTVMLSELRSEPINGKAPKGVLLIFYRGYW
jgi:hypothetical protein